MESPSIAPGLLIRSENLLACLLPPQPLGWHWRVVAAGCWKVWPRVVSFGDLLWATAALVVLGYIGVLGTFGNPESCRPEQPHSTLDFIRAGPNSAEAFGSASSSPSVVDRVLAKLLQLVRVLLQCLSEPCIIRLTLQPYPRPLQQFPCKASVLLFSLFLRLRRLLAKQTCNAAHKLLAKLFRNADHVCTKADAALGLHNCL
jgi:hypothetical protein